MYTEVHESSPQRVVSVPVVDMSTQLNGTVSPGALLSVQL